MAAGWICPVCKGGVSPMAVTCPCVMRPAADYAPGAIPAPWFAGTQGKKPEPAVLGKKAVTSG